MSNDRYAQLVNRVAQYVHEHADDPITLEQLAEHVGVSRFHLGRIFCAATGLQLGEFVQRRRLERAYQLLCEGERSVIEVALSVGYGSHAAFSRAFRKAFGMPPIDVRKAPAPRFRTPALVKHTRRSAIEPDIVTLPERTLVGLYGTGYADHSFTATAVELYRKVARQMGPMGRLDDERCPRIGVSFESPWVGDQEQCRFFAGVELTSGDAPAGLARYRWSAGRWARFVHRGAYTTLWQTVSQVYSGWVVPSGQVLRDAAIVQVYVRGATSPPTQRPETHLYFALDG